MKDASNTVHSNDHPFPRNVKAAELVEPARSSPWDERTTGEMAIRLTPDASEPEMLIGVETFPI
jgi:hypothetical protein